MKEIKEAIENELRDIFVVFIGGGMLRGIYGIVANKFKLPMLNYWFWVLVFVFIAFCMNVFTFKLKERE